MKKLCIYTVRVLVIACPGSNCLFGQHSFQSLALFPLLVIYYANF